MYFVQTESVGFLLFAMHNVTDIVYLGMLEEFLMFILEKRIPMMCCSNKIENLHI
jgi:hypothetical protein